MKSQCTGFDQTVGQSRRSLLNKFGMGLGSIALMDLVSREAASRDPGPAPPGVAAPLASHRPARAKRIIYLFQSGGPSHLDLFDFKKRLQDENGQELPESIRQGQRLTAMSGNQASLPLAGTPFKFSRYGDSGQEISELLPFTARHADDLCIVKSMFTEAINHGPAVTHMQTGSQFPGRPSMGAWLNYGLGSENENLPAFVVMVTKNKGGQPLVSRLWGSGFLPSRFQGVRFRADKNPVLYLNNPNGITQDSRRDQLNALRQLHEARLEKEFNPQIENRIAQYELAFRMQSSIPEAADFSAEPEYLLNTYGPDVKKPGSFAANCLMARRLAERGVRFIQLYHPGWDQHGGLPGGIRNQCRETDQPSAALLQDLKQRGLLEDTLLVWGGEFGRTNYCQGKFGSNFGRDHHPRCFSLWMAGGGIRPGTSYGETDDYGYNIAADGVHVHDFHATLLNQMGIDHQRLTFKHQGRWYRLTDVHGNIIQKIVT
ncbi:MAG: DUF1501 domain-containing protein [Planctomycetota bacterium]|nr:DUF1501 domain-containing protein [Planctomycetota bacterium]